LAISATVVIALIALAGAYGYHRDEVYFLAAGEQLSLEPWGRLWPKLQRLG